jgi:trafficking protein particle complex subunit 11
MAVRFFERIAKTYRRERWGTMLRPLLTTWYKCAQRLGNVELSVRILVEMLAHGTSSLLVRIVVADEVWFRCR